MPLEQDWPLFGLRIETPRLSLSHPSDADLDGLNQVISQGIHDPSWMPFDIPWTDEAPEIRPRHSLQHWWRLRANWTPEDWTLPMMVREGDAIVGMQDLAGINFAISREVRFLAGTSAPGTRHRQGNAGRDPASGVRRTGDGPRDQRGLRGQPGVDRRVACPRLP